MSTNEHHTVDGEASESDDETNSKDLYIKINNYGTAVDGEASESENEGNSIYEKESYKQNKGRFSKTSSEKIKYFKGIEFGKVWFILTEFKFLIWESMKNLLEIELLESTKKLRNADKLLLKSQVTLQNVSYNLQTSNNNTLKLIERTERLKTTQFLPTINLYL